MDEPQEEGPAVDLDATDKYPIVEGMSFEDQNATQVLDYSAGVPSAPLLAESVRSVEAHIARQSADYEALLHSYEHARESEAVATARGAALAAELATLAAEHAAMRTALESRDATIAELRQSIGERNAKLAELELDHAETIPALEEHLKSGTRLGADLESARAQANALALQLKANQDAVAALRAQLKRGESEALAHRNDLIGAKMLAKSYLELLQTREWRRGFQQNLATDAHAEAGAKHLDRSVLQAERDRLQGATVTLEARIAAQVALLAQTRAEQEVRLIEARQPMPALEAEIRRLSDELAAAHAAREQLSEENRKLHAGHERTRADLGRVPTLTPPSVVRPAAPAAAPTTALMAPPKTATPLAEHSAELLRFENERLVRYPLSRRTRIGRSLGCEVRIDSNSISRHHALMLVGPREIIIEDLNSTNGVYVNGRRVTREKLKYGDVLTMGDVQLRLAAKRGSAPGGSTSGGPAPQRN